MNPVNPAPVPVLLSGIPGKTAVTIGHYLAADARFRLLSEALTGPEITAARFADKDLTFALLAPKDRKTYITKLQQTYPDLIVVDFTHPSAVNANAGFFCQQQLPFVMGTTGGDRDQLHQVVAASGIAAVIAPNMARPIVGFQAMLEYAAQNFPGLFQDYHITIKESHQQGKADTSGTAKAAVACFQQMGLNCTAADIIKVRDPHIQATEWGIPPEHLAGHGWHTYTLVSPDQTVRLEFTHNINGRDVYADGTAQAVLFLARQIKMGARGRVFSMIDVLKAGGG